jgi:hypothetical protein
MAISLETTLVLSEESGNIDTEASVAAFRTALLKRIAERELEATSIGEAVTALFDEHVGVSINMPAVASMTCAKLNAQPENFKVLSDRVLDYVRANSQGETTEEGVEERPTSLFVIAKGKNGGCYRRADRPAKVAKPAKGAKASA